MKKKTISIPNRSYTSSADGHLPKVKVSVSMPPWEENKPTEKEDDKK
jgi:hypothetical protein